MPHYFRTPRHTPLHQSASALQRVLKPFPFDKGGLQTAEPTPQPPPQPASALAEASTTLREAGTLVGSAASILNEDMAAGVLAARQARVDAPTSHSFTAVQGGDNKQLLRQVHDFVDAVAAVLPRLQGGAKDWLGPIKTNADKTEDLTILPTTEVRPGDVARINIKLHNDAADSVRLVPHCTALLGDSGYRISEDKVAFTPSELQLGADGSASVTLEASVPNDCQNGKYVGLVKVSGAGYLCAVVVVEVV